MTLAATTFDAPSARQVIAAYLAEDAGMSPLHGNGQDRAELLRALFDQINSKIDGVDRRLHDLALDHQSLSDTMTDVQVKLEALSTRSKLWSATGGAVALAALQFGVGVLLYLTQRHS